MRTAQKLIFTFLLLFVNVIATFAGCYDETVKAGTAAFNSGKYSYARQCFVSAKQCPDAASNANSICDEWIRKIDNKLKPVDNTEAYYKKDLEKGERLFDNEQYADAKSHFQTMLPKYPKYKTDINRYIRMCEMCIADQEEDQQDYMNAYQNGIRTGELLEESGEYEQAKLHYQTMLMTNPDRLLELNARIAVCEEAMRSSNKTFIVNGVSFTMIAVEGGTFTMGATSEQGSDARKNEKPTHNVTVSDFYMGETEVTQALWEAVMGSNPSNWKDGNLPVECVSYNDCQEFIGKLSSLTGKNFSLPTEAEWEYAARGGNRSNGYIYSGGDCLMILLSDVAWYGDNSSSKTHAVKQKQANELGLYDMSGNVWEWCKDWYGDYSSSSQTNPTGPSTGSGRVLRGGGWYGSTRCCRVSNRSYYNPDNRYINSGMRLRLAK